MRRAFGLRGLCLAGAITLALSGSAFAIAIPNTTIQGCSDKIQNGTLGYINAVQKLVRGSIKANINGKDSKCAAGLACVGGANHGVVCTDNTTCATTPPGQCSISTKSGIASKVIKAKAKLRKSINDFCSNASLLALFGTDGTTRCPDPSSPDDGLTATELANCILQGAIGDLANSVFGDPAGEIMARGASEIVPDSPLPPFELCGNTLGSILSIGSEALPGAPAEAGGAAPLSVVGCAAGVCNLQGQGIVGNNLTAPTQTFAGLIPVCLVTVTGDAGGGFTALGSVNLNTGQAGTNSPISSTVMIGTTCPVCATTVPGGCSSSPTLTLCCDSGTNAGFKCSNTGSTDTACPPSATGPVIPNPLALDTEPNTLSVPANNPGGGANNPSATFCGACDLDDTIGCQNDSDCITASSCSGGVGSGCCVFGTNTGAFGQDSVTSATANGKRSQYLPQQATIFCTGKSGNLLVDSTQGLPGPVRLIQSQLNSFQY